MWIWWEGEDKKKRFQNREVNINSSGLKPDGSGGKAHDSGRYGLVLSCVVDPSGCM
jgi:hypothetical protein